MYLPKSKYKQAKYSKGDRFTTAEGKLYVGWYFETYKKEYYSGKQPSNTSGLLTELESFISDDEPVFKNIKNIPTEVDRQQGSFKRYILQDKRNLKIVEVDIKAYNKFVAKDYIVGIELTWIIAGPSEDKIFKGYPFMGAASRNKQETLKFISYIKELEEFIDDYGKFVE